jgi:uncharacterized repeat protein (TIGR01451 family)
MSQFLQMTMLTIAELVASWNGWQGPDMPGFRLPSTFEPALPPSIVMPSGGHETLPPPLPWDEPVVPLAPPEPPVDPEVPVVLIKVRVPACVGAGQEIEYHLCVENCSPAPAHHVRVRNPLPVNARLVRAMPAPTVIGPELQWHLGTLTGGSRCVITLVLAPTDAGDVKNCARVQFEHGQCVCTRIAHAGPAVPLPPVPEVPGPGAPEPGPVPPMPRVPVGDAKLSLAISGPNQQLVGQPVTYQLTVSNPGSAAAGNVLVSAMLPANAKFISAGDNGRFLANQVAWLIGNLDPGASRTLSLVFSAEAAGEVCVNGTALADPNLKAEAQACTIFQGASAMLLEMVDRKDPIPVGGETSYIITVLNQGQIPVTDVRIKAFIPAEMSLIRAKGPTDNKLGEKAGEGQPLLFEPVVRLEPGSKLEYEVFVKALRAGDVRFKVEMSADQLMTGGPVREEESTRVYQEEDETSPPPVAATQSRTANKNKR